MNSLMSILISASSLPNMNSASALASSVLPTPVGPRKMNEPIGRFGSLSPARARRTAFETMPIASSWPMTRACSDLFHVEQPLGLLLGDPRDRDAGPHRDDLGDVLLVDLRLVGRTWRLPLVARSCRRVSRAVASGRAARRLLVLLVVDRRFLLLGDALELLLRLAQGGRRGGMAQADARRRLVDQVDRLVRQEAVGDVADRQVRGGLERLVGDRDLVVLLVALADAHQDVDGLLERRLLDHDRLEAALEGGVALDVLAVLVERGRADALELAAGERRLEDVGGVDRAFGGAGADQHVQLVDEQDASFVLRSSSMTFFSRSSNSPRYLVPATSEPMSRVRTRLLSSVSGTSPATMRWARPSTMAVLPTPGSPISAGLFLVRRDRIWMTRSISFSRPMTGSSLPARAASVRSMPSWSTVGVLLARFVSGVGPAACSARGRG